MEASSAFLLRNFLFLWMKYTYVIRINWVTFSFISVVLISFDLILGSSPKLIPLTRATGLKQWLIYNHFIYMCSSHKFEIMWLWHIFVQHFNWFYLLINWSSKFLVAYVIIIQLKKNPIPFMISAHLSWVWFELIENKDTFQIATYTLARVKFWFSPKQSTRIIDKTKFNWIEFRQLR